MIDVQHRPMLAVERLIASPAVGGLHSPLAMQLRGLAEDMVGRLDRNDLRPEDEERVADLLDAAVEAVLPRVVSLLEAELEPRVEALPLNVRLTLSTVRGRRSFGME